MNKEELQKEIDRLKEQERQLSSQLNATMGARQFAEYLLNKLDDEEPKEE